MTGPLEVRTQLSHLLDAVEHEPELHAEMERAKREFFGGPGPRGQDPEQREASAIRFAEWFLCERESDLLGAVPIDEVGRKFADGVACDLLRESVVGVFMVQSSDADRSIARDVIDNEAIDLCRVPNKLDVGDVLIGRLYASADDSTAFVPSAAMTIVAASPHIAIAYQRDVKQLGLERRLTQVELEHLMFHRGIVKHDDSSVPPLEHVEAQIERILVEAGKSDIYTATALSEALASSTHPGAIIEPLLEEMAFDTDADLDELRHLLLALSTRAREIQTDIPEETTPGADVKVRTRSEPKPFVEREDESLGQRLARRIEEGLSGNEAVEALFADVEAMLGEPIDEVEDSPQLDFDDGDLEPLLREFVWETNADAASQSHADDFLAVQHRAPVPRVTVESLEPDDVSRYVLQAWMAAPAERRQSYAAEAFAFVDGFLEWNDAAQGIARREIVDPVRLHLIEPIARLAAASDMLSGGAEPVGPGRLYTIIGADARGVTVRGDHDGAETDLAISHAPDAFRCEDIVVGVLDPDRRVFDGIAIVVPGALRHLLG